MKKYNLVYHIDGKHINISTDIDLDNHLKRHLERYVKTRTTDWIMKWLHDKGISVEIDSIPHDEAFNCKCLRENIPMKDWI